MQTRQSIRRKQTTGAPSESDLKPWELCWHTDGKLYIGVGESAGHAARVAQITGADAPIAWGDIQNAPAYATRWPKWSEVTQRPTIPTNNTQLTNGRGYVTTDTDTTYSAGAALSLSGTQFNVQAASGKLLGRYSTGTGNAQGITLGSGLRLSGSGELDTAPVPKFDVVRMWDFGVASSSLGFISVLSTTTYLARNLVDRGAMRVHCDGGGLAYTRKPIGPTTGFDTVYLCVRKNTASGDLYYKTVLPKVGSGAVDVPWDDPAVPNDGQFHILTGRVADSGLLDGTVSVDSVRVYLDDQAGPEFDILWIALGRSQRPAYSVGAVNNIEVTNATPTSDANKSGTLYLKY